MFPPSWILLPTLTVFNVFCLCECSFRQSQMYTRSLRQAPVPKIGLRRGAANAQAARDASTGNVSVISFKTETHDWIDGEDNNAENVGRLVQLGWTSWDSSGNMLQTQEFFIKPQGFTISTKATRLHGISQQMAMKMGQNRTQVLTTFCKAIGAVKENNGFLVTHMPEFDYWVILKELRLYHPGETRVAHMFDDFNKVFTINKRYLELHNPLEYGSGYWQGRSLGRALLKTFEIFCDKKVPDDYVLSRSRMHSAGADSKMMGMIFFALRKRGLVDPTDCRHPIPRCHFGTSPDLQQKQKQSGTPAKDTKPKPVPLPGVVGGDFVLAFGQYEGRTLGEVPNSYLAWLVDQRVYMSHPQLAIALMHMGYLDDPAAKVQGGYLDKLS